MRQVTFVCIDRSKAPKVSERQSTILSKFAWKEARNKQTSNLGDYKLGLLSKTRTNSGRTLQTLLHQTRTWPCSMSVPLPRLLITKVSNGSSHHKGAAKLSHHLRFVQGLPLAFALMIQEGKGQVLTSSFLSHMLQLQCFTRSILV